MGKSKKKSKKKDKLKISEQPMALQQAARSHRASQAQRQQGAPLSGHMWYSQVQGRDPYDIGAHSMIDRRLTGQLEHAPGKGEHIYVEQPPKDIRLTHKGGMKNENEPDTSYADSEQEEYAVPETGETGEDGGDGSGESDTFPSPDQQKQIIQMGSITPAKGKHLIHCLTVIGQIEGHYILPPQNKTTKYEHVIPQLVAIEEDPDIEGLVIMLNTVGGDIEAGLAIAELIAGMKKPTVSLVLGGGHSIGVPLAVSARRSFIAPSATMTIHPVRMNGLVLGVPQAFSYFDKMQDRITRFITDNSRIKADRFKELMMSTGELVTDVGTVLDGEQAVAEGLIDDLGSLSDALECLYDMIEQKE